MPPRKRASTTKKAGPAAAQKAATVKAATAAKRGARSAPAAQSASVPSPAPAAAAPRAAKNELEVEVTLCPTDQDKIRLDFSIGMGNESANLNQKRTLRDAFLASCRLQGVDDVEVVKALSVDGEVVTEHSLTRVLGHTDDTFCTVTFR